MKSCSAFGTPLRRKWRRFWPRRAAKPGLEARRKRRDLAAKDVLSNLNLSNKMLLDCCNPFKPDLSGLEVGTTTSGGEMVAEWARGAKVVKIFNTTGSNNMENPVYAGAAIPMFYCGDDAGAKKTAAQLASDTGFEPIDAGPLANARLLEPYAMLWVWLAIKGGMGREFAFQLLKR
jgi:predicted dinucleotide-binding enzyme